MQRFRSLAPLPVRIDPERKQAPGISIVTACKNRNDNLARVLPTWLALDDVSEVIIVDWTSDPPVQDTLSAQNLSDSRLRIIRVEDETEWCLSYAFNTGFRLARFDRILKADADIALDAGFLEMNPLQQGEFIAGNWRTAAPGQKFINGFFFIHYSELARVNGFNEYITTYGWDDDDLYGRLEALGNCRVDVAPGTVSHLDHDDMARLGDKENGGNGWSDLKSLTMFSIRSNRFLALSLPVWDQNRSCLPLRQIDPGRFRRSGRPSDQAPSRLCAQADWNAAYELLFWRAGPRVFELSEEALDHLLTCRRLADITELHVELALGMGNELDLWALAAPRHLVVDVGAPALAAKPDCVGALNNALKRLEGETGRSVVVRSGRDIKGLDEWPRISAEQPSGRAKEVLLDAVPFNPSDPVLLAKLDTEGVSALRVSLAAPGVVRPGEGRLFIEAQHGLGNRMRAVGSAAAIAEATGRELVVVWPLDVHCEAEFGSLFEPNVAIEERAFLEAAESSGATVLNGMETGPNASKGCALELLEGKDAYVRSAYVINHPASHWKAENAALRKALIPLPEILDMAHKQVDVALHIRMETAGGAFDEATNWSASGHAEILHWRAQSHYQKFVDRLDDLLADDPSISAFLAADQNETLDFFRRRYGAIVSGTEIRSDQSSGKDRSRNAQKQALADLLSLSRSKRFLASPWSSFSEVALRLSDSIIAYERSGWDF